METGEEKAWQILEMLNPHDVCKRAEVVFDGASGIYSLKSFGKEFYLSPQEKKIFSPSPGGDIFLQRFGYFFKLSALCYLNGVKDIPFTGRLVKPVNIKGGELFFRGSHILPLDRVAEKYGNDVGGFLKRREELGGEKLDYGDASLRLPAFPRIPVTLILWVQDEEFSSRADLLFDSTCEIQLPLDIIWSIAMLSLLAML